MTQAALPEVVFRIWGSSAMSGVTRVCMTAAVVPAKARVATTAPGRVVLSGVLKAGLQGEGSTAFHVYDTHDMHDAHNMRHAHAGGAVRRHGKLTVNGRGRWRMQW
ncbi:hypothetical protein Kisp02_24170 [Kineosporia sp. NBRC 101731]|nr:hypothetical protein Kisp02_24170 [Kineosporia sp. NBRC 101731]